MSDLESDAMQPDGTEVTINQDTDVADKARRALEAKREAERMLGEYKNEAVQDKKARKEARKQAEREAKEQAKREAEGAKRAAAEEKKQAEAAKKAEKEACKQAKREAKEAAKRESKEGKKAQKDQSEVGMQDVQSDEAKDWDRSQTELLSNEPGDAAIIQTKPTAPANRPIPKHDVFEGRVQLLIPKQTESTFVKQLETLLMEMDDSRIVCSCGSAEGGKTIIFHADKPVALIQTLSEYPIVETVTRKGKDIQVTLGSNQEKMAAVADT